MKKILLIILICIITKFTIAQDDKQKVERACLNYIEGFYEGDTTKLIASLKPSLYKIGFWKNEKSDKYEFSGQMTYRKALDYAKGVQEKNNFPKADAPKKVEVIEVMNAIANRYNEINPEIDKRTCGYKRRLEATTKTTSLLEPMITRALDMGVRAKYVVMDSWFSMPSVISNLRKHIHVICMLKAHPKWLYEHNGKKFRLTDLYNKLEKKRGKAKIKAAVIVKISDGNTDYS